MSNLESMNHSKWVLDPSHSELSFKVKHLMISNVQGAFRKFTAEINGDNFMNAPIQVVIESSSIYTNDESRDGHLKAADFFDAENHPQIKFQSSSMEHLHDNQYKLLGELTIKGLARPVSLELEFGGLNKDPWGNEKMAFSLQGKISRKEWGLNWNATLESGGVLVSDEVKINAEIQMVKQA